jgi:hypothetical protein
MCRGSQTRILLHLHIQLEGTVLRGSLAGLHFGCRNQGTVLRGSQAGLHFGYRNHPSCVHV